MTDISARMTARMTLVMANNEKVLFLIFYLISVAHDHTRSVMRKSEVTPENSLIRSLFVYR